MRIGIQTARPFIAPGITRKDLSTNKPQSIDRKDVAVCSEDFWVLARLRRRPQVGDHLWLS
jgi:hypothetical protein